MPLFERLALQVFTNRWDFQLVASALEGVCRFDQFQASVGISRKVLAQRLKALLSAGIFERCLYQRRPDRYEYRLTEKGRALMPVLEALSTWTEQWASRR